MKRFPSLPLGLLILSLVGCTGDRLLQRLVPPDADDFARSVIGSWHSGDVAALLGVGSGELTGSEGVEGAIAESSRRFPGGMIEEVELIGANVHIGSDRTIRDLTYEVRTEEGVVLVAMRVSETRAGRFLDGMQMEQVDASVRDLHAFQLRGKSAVHHAMLILAVVVFLFCVAVAVRIARTPMPRRWLWVVVALVGVGTTTLDWTTGETQFRLLSLQLFGVGVQRLGMLGPWYLSVGVPVGALLALVRRRRVLAALEGAGEGGSNEDGRILEAPGEANSA